jgi:dTDP-3-amino-3,4,6-trideoxy-alpha-D-glucose transaminase
VRPERADEVASALEEEGIGARGYYRVPVHRQPAMADYGAGVELPGTDEAARTHLALPMGPLLTHDQVQEVVRALASLP